MSALKLKENIYWVGVEDKELRVFDIIMETKKGTTYNSYLIEDEKIAIIDSVKDGFYSEFKKNIKEIIKDKKVDYIVVQHTELDHSGSVIKLLEDYPEAKIVASKAAITYLKNIINKDFDFIEAKEELNLGKTTLKFISVPNLHWPDTIFTYVESKKVLFTCDFTGCHYASPVIGMGCKNNDLNDKNEYYFNSVMEPFNIDKEISQEADEEYYVEMKYYFDCIMGPFKKFVLMALDKIKLLKFDVIAPSHGPIHFDEQATKVLNLYNEWAKDNKREDKNIQIFYISAYGNTESMAKYLEKKINELGISSESHEITKHDTEFLINKIENASGILIGSPTINQDAVKPAWDLLSHICPITNRGKIACAFGSYGWSGEGVTMLNDRLKSLKFNVISEGIKFIFVPSTEDFSKADELIKKIVEKLK